MKWLTIFASILLFLWLLVFLTDSGILVKEELVPYEVSSSETFQESLDQLRREEAGIYSYFICKYFVAIGFVERKYSATEIESCPRWIKLKVSSTSFVFFEANT